MIPGGFTKIPERTGGVTERLPAIVDDGKWVLDSWGIVEYLDETYPDRPTLIPHPSVAAMTRALDAWFWGAATGPWMRCNCVNYRDLANEDDHELHHLFAREDARQVARGNAGRLGRPPRRHLGLARAAAHRAAPRSKYLGGETPNYADYRLARLDPVHRLGVPQRPPVLAADDPLRPSPWIDSLQDMFGGLGRHPRPVPLARARAARRRSRRCSCRVPGLGGIHKRNTGVESTRAETSTSPKAWKRGPKPDAGTGHAALAGPKSSRRCRSSDIGRNRAPIGTLVGNSSFTVNNLVQLDPLYVTFNPSESDLSIIQAARDLRQR